MNEHVQHPVTHPFEVVLQLKMTCEAESPEAASVRALEVIDEVFRENQWEDLLCYFWSATGKGRRRSYRWVRAAQQRPPSGAEKWPELRP